MRGRPIHVPDGPQDCFVVKNILGGYRALNRSVAAGTTRIALFSMGRIIFPYVLHNHSKGASAVLDSQGDGFSTKRSRNSFLDAEDAESSVYDTGDGAGDA